MNTQEKEQLFREAFAQIERIETALDEKRSSPSTYRLSNFWKLPDDRYQTIRIKPRNAGLFRIWRA